MFVEGVVLEFWWPRNIDRSRSRPFVIAIERFRYGRLVDYSMVNP